MRALFRVFAIVSAVTTSGASSIAQQTTDMISVNALGQPGNEAANDPSISEDGQFVVFHSRASNLVPGDLITTYRVYCRQWQAGTFELVSVNSAGKPANFPSWRASVSADGRWVAFESAATNLAPGDDNGTWDIFVRDRLLGVTVVVSVSSSGIFANNISYLPAISGDGSCVAFYSDATNLVPGAPGGIFVHELQTGLTEVVSVDSSGNPGTSTGSNASISRDGRLVAFDSSDALVPGDTDEWLDVFLHDRLTGVTELVSAASSTGPSYLPSLSADGRFVAFTSSANDLVPGDDNGVDDVFVRDRLTGVIELVSVSSSGAQGNSFSYDPSISQDGRFVAFHSSATNLSVLEDAPFFDDVFVHDRLTGVTELVSIDSFGNPGNGFSERSSISADGRHVAFESTSDNLVPAETGGLDQVYVRDRSCIDAYVDYCTPGTSANGCEVELTASGVASSSASSGFVVTALSEGEKDGLFFYGQNGRQAVPWGNGTSFICVIPPVKRAGLQQAHGTPGACDAIVAQDLNAWWCSTCPKPSAAPLPSKPLQIQFWYRDPASTSNQTSSLSDAIEVIACP